MDGDLPGQSRELDSVLAVVGRAQCRTAVWLSETLLCYCAEQWVQRSDWKQGAQIWEGLQR